MADLVAVMRDGELQQLAPPTELYDRPANLFVARFCGSPPMNVLHGEVDGRRLPASGRRRPPGRPRRRRPGGLGFRPEHVTIVEPGADAALAGEIYVVEPLGNETLVAVRVGDELINVRAPADFAPSGGARCGLRPTARHLHLFDPESGEARRDAAAEALPPPMDVPSPRKEHGMTDPQGSIERARGAYTRRQVLKGALGTGAALGLAPLLAACGGGASASSGSSGGRGRRHDHHRQLPGQRDGAVPEDLPAQVQGRRPGSRSSTTRPATTPGTRTPRTTA